MCPIGICRHVRTRRGNRHRSAQRCRKESRPVPQQKTAFWTALLTQLSRSAQLFCHTPHAPCGVLNWSVHPCLLGADWSNPMVCQINHPMQCPRQCDARCNAGDYVHHLALEKPTTTATTTFECAVQSHPKQIKMPDYRLQASRASTSISSPMPTPRRATSRRSPSSWAP